MRSPHARAARRSTDRLGADCDRVPMRLHAWSLLARRRPCTRSPMQAAMQRCSPRALAHTHTPPHARAIDTARAAAEDARQVVHSGRRGAAHGRIRCAWRQDRTHAPTACHPLPPSACHLTTRTYSHRHVHGPAQRANAPLIRPLNPHSLNQPPPAATVCVRPALAGEGRYFVRVPVGTNVARFEMEQPVSRPMDDLRECVCACV
jgi:hypothetical protein